jgi:alpha-tubulin suppressor-like RCC1 family protein
VPVAGGHTFMALSAGVASTCGLDAAGVAYCWGDNSYGELGVGTTTGPEVCPAGLPYRTDPFPCSTVPVRVAGELAWAAVTVGASHACALTPGGAAYCWGANYTGSLGDGTTTPRSIPVPVVGGLTFTNLSAGGAHTCGVTRERIAYCWGQAGGGQLGIGTPALDSAVPVRVSGQP